MNDMQNSDINFDDFFRARLTNQEATVAPDMFERIMHERKRRRKPLFWWSFSTTQKMLLGGVLFVSASFLGWKYFAQQTIFKNKFVSNNETLLSALPQLPPPNAAKIPPMIEQKQESGRKKKGSTQHDNFTKRQFVLQAPPSVTAQKAKGLPSFGSEVNENASTDLVINAPKVIETLASINTKNGIAPNTQSIENQAENIGLTVEKLEDFGFLNTKKLLPLANSAFQTPDNMQGVLDDGCKSFNKKKKKLPKPSSWFLDVYGSPDYAIRRLQNVSGDFQNYIQARDTTEARWYAFSAGARISRVLKSSVALRVGLHYAQINEIFDYKQHDFTRITRTTVEIRDVSGALLRVDTLEKVEIGLRQRTDYNRYRAIDLPLQLGYELGNKKITWSGNLGLNLNLYSWQSGKVLNTNFEPTEVENSQAFRTQVGLSVFASVGCYINIHRNWQFLLEPNIRYQIGSWTSNNYPLRQDYTTLGLFTGLRYRFEKKKRFFF